MRGGRISIWIRGRGTHASIGVTYSLQIFSGVACKFVAFDDFALNSHGGLFFLPFIM